MRFLMLGSDNFAEPLRQLGHEVIFCGPGNEADLTVASQDVAWPELSRKLRQLGFKPDVIMVCDNVGYRTLPVQLFDSDAFTVFYGIDSPLNRFWQLSYARLFDLAFLDQPEEAKRLANSHCQAHWLPVGIRPEYYQGHHDGPMSPGGVFVGVVNEKVRPKRSALLNLLAKETPLEIAGGRGQAWFPTEKAAEMYRGYQFVLNENLFPGLTTRPLEVMASGGALLTEEAPGSMDRYFNDQEHLLYFSPADLHDKLNLLLEDSALRGRLARNGREAVLAGHTLRQRAEQIVESIRAVVSGSAPRYQKPGGYEALYLEGRALMMAGLRWPGKGGSQRILAGTGRLLAAAGDKDRPTPMAKWAGLAAMVMGEFDACLKYLQMAAESGAIEESLVLALAAAQLKKPDLARKALRLLAAESSELSTKVGPMSLNLVAARILTKQGRGITPGFDSRKLPQAMWSALEHMIEACQTRPGDAGLWEELGDLLLSGNAPNEAHHFYTVALGKSDSPSLREKIEISREKGYLYWAKQ